MLAKLRSKYFDAHLIFLDFMGHQRSDITLVCQELFPRISTSYYRFFEIFVEAIAFRKFTPAR
ncbi:hypothetical protein O3G_MSEX012366 [Manduca sexta]|uniref:Uncharacterized protein n=1 Tax=Manduca sexta TaxID=7130 RepID=A0A922CX02_MANSE|nr:hypothetical protein O3G_MSEX012366 [Manduca sexta]